MNRCALIEGFSLHADVRVREDDRVGLECLARGGVPNRVLGCVWLLLASGCWPQGSGPLEVPVDQPVVALTAAGDLTCARMKDGNSACWGASDYGADGYGLSRPDGPTGLPLEDNAESLATSGFHSCAVLSAGAVHCWGANPNNFLAVPNASCDPSPLDGTCVSRPGATLLRNGAVEVVTGGSPPIAASESVEARGPRPLTCARMEGGTVECWGDNLGGGLGSLDTEQERRLPDRVFDASGFPLREVAQVAVGGNRGYALDVYGGLWAWGGGMSPGAYRPALPRARHIAVGEGHACLATAGGAVMCWGENAHGQAGDTRAANACDPESSSCTIGPTLVPGVDRAVEVAVGGHHSCALDLDGRVLCWGYGLEQRLGSAASLISEPVPVPLPGKAAQIALGRGHSCALMQDGAVMCWGLGNRGQLGVRL